MNAPTQAHTFIPQQDHFGLSTTIDTLYIESVIHAAHLRRWLCIQVGNIREPYLTFYEAFMALFTMTYKHKEMIPYTDLAKKIRIWAYPSNHINPDKCMKGVDLFDEWQDGLFKAGLLSVRK